jgi:serine/threonine protein phosphatase PrpC
LREYEQRGGTVTRDSAGTPRTAGGLMMPCSIGESEAAVSCRPTVSKYPIPPGGATLVLGCDGLFDYLSSNDVAHVVSSTEAGEGVEALAPRLAKAAFVQGSQDNISAMVVRIPPRQAPAV